MRMRPSHHRGHAGVVLAAPVAPSAHLHRQQHQPRVHPDHHGQVRRLKAHLCICRAADVMENLLRSTAA